ncbi:MAG: methyl-accepting chemotaxis protein [Nitrospirota bacterium]|nr:methyl-accepting chemotaxis protein [Nitrospirota bacterium]
MPVRRLMVLGTGMMLATVLTGVVMGTLAIRELSQGFAGLERTWRHADAAVELNTAAFKAGWAASLAEHGRVEEARAAYRQASAGFEENYLAAQAKNADPVGLNAARQLFMDLGVLVEERIQRGGQGDAAFHARLDNLQTSLDQLLTRIEETGDARMEEATTDTGEKMRGITVRLVALGALAILACVAAGILVTLHILRGLDKPVVQIAASSDRLSRVAQYHVRSAAEQSSAMVQISSTMQQLLASFRDMTARSHEMVRTSRDAAEECHKGHTLLLDSQQGMERIKREVGRITDHMHTLEEKSQQINSVLEMINELASQTNLLSINATIEAAGAGDAGRRFAVVAEEIRLLAERAVEFTEEIRVLIEDIQETAHVTSAATAEGARSVDSGLGKSSKIKDNFDTLITLVTRTADAVQAIETTTREQVYSVEQVTDAVESLSHIASESEMHAGSTLEAVEHLQQVAGELQVIAGRTPYNRDGSA